MLWVIERVVTRPLSNTIGSISLVSRLLDPFVCTWTNTYGGYFDPLHVVYLTIWGVVDHDPMGSRSLDLTISGSDDLTIWGLSCREVSRRDILRHGVKQRYVMRTVVPVQAPLRIAA